MKSIKLISLSTLLAFSICSCGDSDEKSKGNSGNNINIDAVANAKSNDPNAKGDNKCLLEYADKYDQLLTEDMVMTVTGFSKEKLETKYSKVMKNNEHHSITYKFKMGRKQMVKQVGMMLELPETVSLKGIKPISLKQFEDSYRAMTAEEEASFEEVKKDIISGESGNKDADKELKKAENLGVSKKDIEKGTTVLSEEFKKVGESYVVVQDLADAARWNTYTRELVVLHNGVQFEITVDVSEDEEKNKTVAIDLARQIVNKCK